MYLRVGKSPVTEVDEWEREVAILSTWNKVDQFAGLAMSLNWL